MPRKPNPPTRPRQAIGGSGSAIPRSGIVAMASGAAPPESTGTTVPPSRQGKKALTGFFDPSVSREIKQLALNEGKTVQSLLAEAVNDLFVKYGRTPIAS